MRLVAKAKGLVAPVGISLKTNLLVRPSAARGEGKVAGGDDPLTQCGPQTSK